MKSLPTFLGKVGSVSGATISIRLAQSVASGLAIIDGSTYRIGQVGSFVRIPLGYQDLYGVVSEVGVKATPENVVDIVADNHGWMTVQLVGESIGGNFERGISQHPNVNDDVHIVTEKDLGRIYGGSGIGQVVVGQLSSAESIEVQVELEKLVTRHSAILGSTGSGKSTTVASLLRSIVSTDVVGADADYPSARIVLLDIHGEYAGALADVSRVYRINANKDEHELYIPYWALSADELIDFLVGVSDDKSLHFFDKITALKTKSHKKNKYPGIDARSLTVDSPVPYSLKQLWYDLIDPELMTLEGPGRDEPALIKVGDPDTLTPPQYKPHGLGSAGPFLNNSAPGLKRPLGSLRSRLLDRQYDFLLHPGEWEPDLDGTAKKDLPELLEQWLGHDKPVTILDLSGVPSAVLVRLVGAILKIVYEALFWARDKSEGGIERPLLVVMEEAHRYLGPGHKSPARDIVQRIVKEGRKYGIGAMVVSQRPSEVDETILSQCGTFFALRLSNQADRSRVQGTLPDNLVSLMDMLPVLRTGEAVITGEAARMPIRCRIRLPKEERRPDSRDPLVAAQWSLPRREESYERVAASWRAQSPRAKDRDLKIERKEVDDSPSDGEQD